MQDAGNVGPSDEDAVEEVKESIVEAFGTKGDCTCSNCTCDELGNIKVGPLDCALVFRDEDGESYPELFLPKYESNEDTVSVSATLCSIIAMRISDPEFIKECYEWMDDRMEELGNNEELVEVDEDDEGRTN